MLMQGKVCLITGGARGMGLVTARALAEQGIEKLILVDWEGECGTRARDEVNAITGKPTAEFIYCDLSSMAQVRALAADINSRYEVLHVLINNAGITDPVRRLSVDGYEMHVATCHLGHFLLTNLLLDLLKSSAPARIINISSDAHKAGPGIDFDDFNNEKIWGGKTFSNNAAFQAYHRAKICNIYMMQELAPRLEPFNVTINAVSPGYFINTTIYRNMRGVFKLGATMVFGLGSILGLNTPEKGARSHIYLASSQQAEGVTGKYFEHAKEKAMGETAENTEARKQVWRLSEDITGVSYAELAPVVE
ncbi:MAG TPA: SDR family NAD(P)-dependent oxidoreductase [Porticoccus sp.]|nr:SDR family NAD(P)-dependent oxidoreductase [Porticoccus sp.]